MEKVKCPHCGHLLFKARSADLEIKCLRCKKIVEVKMKEQSEPHTK
ncbi:Com family DNA-binding transcriptional regulator [Paenibacillus pabuli]|nr:Com family DNA-binding transcriptional regulator [Paenibacillus pabuli]